jgi:CheY-like chemotaxis protein
MSKSRMSTTILIAEDDPDDRLLCQEALEEIHFEHNIFFVQDGEELLEYLCHKGQYQIPSTSPRPDLILLDLNMPRRDGRDTLQEIKKREDLRLIPVVVMTTSRSEDDIARCYDLGVNGYVIKPVHFQSLIDIMSVIKKYWFEVVELPIHRKATL